jgi:hypothetical protein
MDRIKHRDIGATTFSRRSIRLFRRHHGNFLLKDNFFGGLGHLKEISEIMLRTYEEH